MNKWSFCFISVGESPYLQTAIDSVRAYGPEDSEIIVIGGDIIPNNIDIWKKFDETIKAGWITKKKNLAACLASNDNLCMAHDYVALEPGWYDGVKEFGENWLTCMHRVLQKDGTRYRDWLCVFNDSWMNPPIDNRLPPTTDPARHLSYTNNTWGRWMNLSGTYFCVKKKILQECPLNEERCQNQGEDVEMSRRLYKKYGQSAFTMNTLSSVRILKDKEIPQWQKMEEITDNYKSIG
jgi:hypothetical protein